MFIATQLNSTQLDVELSCVAIDTSPTQLNSTRRRVELSCVAINTLTQRLRCALLCQRCAVAAFLWNLLTSSLACYLAAPRNFDFSIGCVLLLSTQWSVVLSCINLLYIIGTLAVDGWAPPRPLLVVPNGTAHPNQRPVYQLYIILYSTIITLAL